MSTDRRQQGASQPATSDDDDRLTWAELWARLGKDGDATLSVTQARLAADAFDVETPPTVAVEEHDLVTVEHPTAGTAETPGDRETVRAGYRLVGEPSEVSES